MNKSGTILLFFLIAQCKTVFSDSSAAEAYNLAGQTLMTFLEMFSDCLKDPISTAQFESDDIKKFIIFPSKTTVGFAPKYTGNRKFFANLITTPAFKEMLEKDKNTLLSSYVRKLKYCDQAVMDPSLLNDFYDREVDLNKM